MYSDVPSVNQISEYIFSAGGKRIRPVLVGDFLYSRSLQRMVRLDNKRVQQILPDVTNVIGGEVLQLLNMHDPDVTEASYLNVIRSKTAKLFEAAAQLGALIAG